MLKRMLFKKKSCSADVFVYPRLPAVHDLGFIRFRGSGLANCLFVASRAFLIAERNGWNFVNPTWGNITLGPYVRNEKDKRHYFGLFKKTGISGLSKIMYLLFLKEITLESAISGGKGKIIIKELGNYFDDLNYFEDLLEEQVKVKMFIHSILRKEIFLAIKDISFENVIGIHIRLGDHQSELRVSVDWYETVVNEIIDNHGSKYRFFVFSDGQDHELSGLLSTPQVERVFFGNALSDIIALSKCKLIIGSDSTFSGWAAFLEQVPVIFPKRHFGKTLIDTEKELVFDGEIGHIRSFINDHNIL